MNYLEQDLEEMFYVRDELFSGRTTAAPSEEVRARARKLPGPNHQDDEVQLADLQDPSGPGSLAVIQSLAQITVCTARWLIMTRRREEKMTQERNAVTVEQLAAAAATFDLLSVPGRLHLVWLLSAEELDVTTLAERTDATIPSASQQLAKLRAAGVVSARRDGRRQLYRVDDPHILSVISEMFSHIAPDGTLAPNPSGRRPPQRPRFAASR